MFSKEDLGKGLKALVITLIALAIHQKFISPLLVSKPKVAAPTK